MINQFNGITYRLIYDDRFPIDLLLSPDGVFGKHDSEEGCVYPLWMWPCMDEL